MARPKYASTKRSRAIRSKSAPAPRNRQIAMRTRVFAAPSVGLGASAKTVLRTSFFANCTAAVGTGIFTGYLKPGSVFDPCGDQAAVQPALLDQFALVYQRYKVEKCTIKMKITGAAGTYTWVCAAYPSVDATALATYQAAASQPYAKTTSGGFQTLIGSAVGIGAEPKMIFHRLIHDAVVGSKSDSYDSGALVTADPTANQYMVYPFFLQGNGAGTHTWVIEVDMYQTVVFSQRKNVVDA